VKKFLLFIWQLPQNLLGWLVYMVNMKSVKEVYDGSLKVKYYTAKHVSDRGISLGMFIFLDSDRVATSIRIRHESGHQKQSEYLGWLYLIVIGLPSLVGNILRRYIKFDYYSTWWEHSADVLGGVKR